MLDEELFKTLFTQISVLAKLVEHYQVTTANAIRPCVAYREHMNV